MIRIVHTLLFFLCVAAALIGYGAAAENEALEREIETLVARKAALEQEILLFEAEWDYVSGAEMLRATAAKLFRAEVLRDADGVELSAWRPEQLLVLERRAPQVEDPFNLETASIPTGDGRAPQEDAR